MQNKRLICLVDGSCIMSTRTSGWAYVYCKQKSIPGTFTPYIKNSGTIQHSTNNYAELFGMKELLGNLPNYNLCEIYSDSEYVLRHLFDYPIVPKNQDTYFISSCFKGRSDLNGRCLRGTRTHIELWQETIDILDRVASKNTLYFHWIRGHIKPKVQDDIFEMHDLVDKLSREKAKILF